MMETTVQARGNVLLYRLSEGEHIYGEYLLSTFAYRHLIALYVRYPRSQVTLTRTPITSIDQQRVVIDGWRVGVGESVNQVSAALELGTYPLTYVRVDDLHFQQGELVGTVSLRGHVFEVVYHALTLTWYLRQAQQEGEGTKRDQAVRSRLGQAAL